MFKRVLMVLLLIGGLIAIHGVDVDAHLAGYTYDPTFRHIASYDCTGHFENVPNPKASKSSFECEAIAKSFEVLCQNPNEKQTFGNNIATFVASIGGGSFTDLDFTNWEQGKVTKTVPLPENVKAAADAFCKARNRRWSVFAEFVTSVDVSLRTFEFICPQGQPQCQSPQKVQAFEALLRCHPPINPDTGTAFTLDPGVNNPPPPGALPFDCVLLDEAHCDAGDTCPIDSTLFALRQEVAEQPYRLNAGIHSLWNQTRRALSMDRNEPQLMKLARATTNMPIM